jgi:hypothetical protein
MKKVLLIATLAIACLTVHSEESKKSAAIDELHGYKSFVLGADLLTLAKANRIEIDPSDRESIDPNKPYRAVPFADEKTWAGFNVPNVSAHFSEALLTEIWIDIGPDPQIKAFSDALEKKYGPISGYTTLGRPYWEGRHTYLEFNMVGNFGNVIIRSLDVEKKVKEIRQLRVKNNAAGDASRAAAAAKEL